MPFVVAGATGAIITDSVGALWVRTANAFDGTTSQAGSASAAADGDGAATNGATFFIGKDWSAVGGGKKTISRIQLYGPNNNGLFGSGGATISFDGWDGAAWVALDSFASSGASSELIDKSYSAPVGYSKHRISSVGNGVNGKAIAEFIFYENKSFPSIARPVRFSNRRF